MFIKQLKYDKLVLILTGQTGKDVGKIKVEFKLNVFLGNTNGKSGAILSGIMCLKIIWLMMIEIHDPQFRRLNDIFI